MTVIPNYPLISQFKIVILLITASQAKIDLYSYTHDQAAFLLAGR